METKILSSVNTNYINSVKQTPKTEAKKEQTTSSKVIKGISVAAAVGVTALAVGGIILRNKKMPNILKLSETINFREAKTLDEAIEYGTKTLGIKHYEGFKNEDLDVVNWINEGLTMCANKAKSKGQIVMPKKISYIDDIGEFAFKSGEIGEAGGSMDCYGTMQITKSIINDLKNTVIETVRNSNMTEEAQNEFIKGISTKRIFDTCSKLKFDENDATAWRGGTYSIITHEMGHLQHRHNMQNLKLYESLGTSRQRPEKLAKGAEELLELFNSKQDIIGKISSYAKESPKEFVAEVYSQLVHGVKVDDEIMELYKKFGGVV